MITIKKIRAQSITRHRPNRPWTSTAAQIRQKRIILQSTKTPAPIPASEILERCHNNGKLERDVSRCVQIIGTHYIDFGDYSDIWEARLEGEPGKVVVRMIRGGSPSDPVWVNDLKKQLVPLGEVWIQLRHRNVSRFLGFTFTLQPMPGLVSPFYPHGHIMRYLAKNPAMSIQRKVELISGVARAVKYLHYFDPVVVHGALRGLNVMIDAEGHPILCGYGLAFASAKMVSYRWAAPEILNPKEDTDLAWTTQSDVYAFAMTMLEIVTGQPPFANKKHENRVVLSVVTGKRPQLPPAMVTHEKLGVLVKECWAQDPGSRLDMYNVCLRLESDILGLKVENAEVP